MERFSWTIWEGPMQSQRSNKKEAGGLETGRKIAGCYNVIWEDMRRTPSQRMQVTSRSWNRQGKSPLEPSEGTQRCQHLDFSPVRPSGISDAQNYQVMNLYSFKPLSV